MKSIIGHVCKTAWAAGLLALAPIVAAAVEIDPLTTCWTFGAHEPYTMYRRANGFLPRLEGLANVSVRKQADLVNATLNWCYVVPPQKDGGKALMADLAKVGWKVPIPPAMPCPPMAHCRLLRSIC